MYREADASHGYNAGDNKVDNHRFNERSSRYITTGGWLVLCFMFLLGFIVTSLGIVAAVYGLITQLRDLIFLGVALICMGTICLIVALIQFFRKYRAISRTRNVYPLNKEVNESIKFKPDNTENYRDMTDQNRPVKSILRETQPNGVKYPVLNGVTVTAHEDKNTKHGVSAMPFYQVSEIDYSKLYTQSNDVENPEVVVPDDANVSRTGDKNPVSDAANAATSLTVIKEEIIPNR